MEEAEGETPGSVAEVRMINLSEANKYEQRQHWRSDCNHRAAGRYYFDESGSHPVIRRTP
jgi:hypothetical protein